MLSQAESKRVIDRVLSATRAIKGAEALVRLESSHEGNSRFAVNELTTSGDTEDQSITLQVQLGLRLAGSSVNQIDDAAIDDLVQRTATMARLAPENPELMPVLGAQRYAAIPGAVDGATSKLSPEARAKAAAAIIASADSAKVTIAGFFEHAHKSFALGSSAGLSAYHTWTSCGLSTTARTTDGTGSGWASAQSNRVADLDAAALARTAIDKATTSAQPRKLEPGRYTVVLEPAAVAELVSWMCYSLNARGADEGRSFFTKNKPGTKLFPETITLRSDASDPTLGAMPFDGDGMPAPTARWFDKGTLTALAYTRFWAKKQGKTATGYPNSWTLDGGTATRDELIKGVDKGVLITRFWYTRYLDPQTILITGLTRDGTFLIEDGKITTPVNNFRFNESPIQVLARCDGLSKLAAPTGGWMRTPALRTHEFNLASISEAV